MTLFEKVVNISIIAVLLVHMTIGTPFSIGMADEILNNETISADIPAVDNTIGAEEITVELPVTEVLVGDEDSTTTITYTDDTTIAENLENSEENTTSDIVTVYEEQTGGTDSFSGSEENTFLSGNENTTTAQPIENTSDSSSENNILSTGDIIIPPIPDIVTTYPQQQVMISGGRIDPLSLESYNVVDNNNPDITFCSYITYLNIKQLTNTGDDYIMRGDAVDIWSQLVLNRTVTIASGDDSILSGIQYIFTGTNLSGEQFIDFLSGVYNNSGDTIFDIVTLKPKESDDNTIGLSLHQSHRFVIFFGTDELRYVLDPIRTHSSDPILLDEYLANHIFDQENLQLVQSYTIQDKKIEDDNNINPTRTGIVVHSALELLPYVLQGLITAPLTGESITNELVFQTGFIYETTDSLISAYIPAGMSIKTANEDHFNMYKFSVNTGVDNTEGLIASGGNEDVFQFGVSGQHLIFSHPIELTIQTPDQNDGDILNLLVQHEGESWSKKGLTQHAEALCNSEDGSVGEGDQLESVQIQDKKAIFYTCGASSFALGYVPGLSSPNNSVVAIREQADGKFLIGGTFTTIGGVARNRIARLNPDKSLDTTFNPNANNTVNDIEIQDDGKILIAGAFTGVGATTRTGVLRLNSDGSLDTTFNATGSATVNDIEIQSDGNILIGGTFTSIGGATRNRIARVSSTGALDTTFNPNASTTVNDIQIQPDGMILVGGGFSTIGGVTRKYIARLSSAGVTDTTFNPNVVGSLVNDIKIQDDGKILVGGTFTTVSAVVRTGIVRLNNADGSLDTTFNANVATTIVNSIAIQSDGNILIGGTFTSVGGIARSRIARVTSLGALDTTFNPNASTTVSKIIIGSNNKIIVGGLFVSIGGISQSYLAFLDNTIFDTNYNVRPNGVINKVLVQPDGKILIAGAFTSIGAVARNRIARLNTDRTLDMSFNPNANGAVNDIKIQDDGKILIGGAFSTIGATTRTGIVRLNNADGSLDTTFNATGSATVNSIAVQPDGKILLGGSFTTIGGVARNRIARVTSTGGLDTTFNPNASTTVNDIEIQSDGMILIGGVFTTMGATTRTGIVRVSTAGVVDATFNANVVGTPVNDIEIQSDGMIVVGGAFTSIGGATRNRIARLSTVGVADSTFNPNANNIVNSLYLLANGDIVFGGSFATVGGVARLQLAKVSSLGVLDSNFNIPFSASKTVSTIDEDIEGNLVIGGTFTSLNGNANNTYFGWVGLNNTLNNLSLWLKADTGTSCIIDGCSISEWNDSNIYSYNNAIQSTTAAQPIYKDNMVNGNPAINFNSTAKYMTSSITGVYKTIFAVRNLPETIYQTLFASPANSDFSIRNATAFDGTSNFNYTDGPNANDWSFGGSLTVNGKTTNIGEKKYHIVKAVSATATTGSYSISSTFSSRGMYGNDAVAEIIAYSTGVDSITANEIQSYLATKYGITLDQSVAGGQNYILSNGVTSWATGVVGTFNNDIAGIVRDDGMNLLQKKTQSINNNEDIIIEQTGSMNNLSSLMRSNNAGSTGSWGSIEVPSGMNTKMGRERMIQEKNGDIGTITLTYPIATGSLPNGDLILLVDTDSDFSNGGTSLITGFIISGYWTFNTNIPDNTYISFGIKSNGNVCIEGASSVSFSINASNVATSDLALTNQFKVTDERGSSSGYYTTISISNLTGLLGNTISSAANIVIAGGGLMTLSGSANPDVVLDTTISSSWISASSPVQFIKRNSGTPAGIYGTYAAQLAIQISLPAYQSVDTYTGTITYTLYEN